MTVKLSLLAFNKTGQKVSGTVEADTLSDAAAEYELLKTFAEQEGWVTAPNEAAFQASPLAAPQAPQQGSGFRCVLDGAEVTGEDVNGKWYPPEQIASGRTEKLRKLNVNPAGPMCGDCWKRGGYAAKYKAAFPFRPGGR